MGDAEVIVAGSGPGGTLAAYTLARSGVEVWLLERSRHPRLKACGGGVSRKVARLLDFSLDPIVEATIRGAWLAYQGHVEAAYDSPEPVAWMVMRDRLDALLAHQARAAGARLLEDTVVQGVYQEENGTIQVQTSRGTFTCQYLIGADGAHSQVRRSLGARRPRLAPALEWEIQAPSSLVARFQGRVWIDVGWVPWGYGWVFPKQGRLSTGLAGFGSVGPQPRRLVQPRETLMRFLGQFESGVLLSQPTLRMGHPIPLYIEAPDLGRDRMLLVGDAAGLVDPFFGEGIYYALRSGQLAAEAILKARSGGGSPLGAYETWIHSELVPEFEAARSLAQWIYRNPRWGCWLLGRHTDLIEAYFEALRGRGGYVRFASLLRQRALTVLGREIRNWFWGMERP